MNSGFSKGFGTVVFTTAQDAQAAIDMFNGFDLKGRFIDVREDRIPEKEAVIAGDAVAAAALRPLAELGPITSKALYIGNVPYSVGWQDLKDLCRQYGNVVRADIPQDYNHRSKGFGTVVMSTLEESKLVATKLHGFEWNGRRLDVREDRKYTDVGAAVAAATAAHNSNAVSVGDCGCSRDLCILLSTPHLLNLLHFSGFY